MIANASIASKTVVSAPELLWTNPNPYASFAAQNVAVSGDYAGYIVEIKSGAQNSVSGNQYRQMYVPNPLIIDQYTPFYISGTFGSSVPVWRKIYSMEDGVFSIGSGYRYVSYQDKNDEVCIPTRIWGVKWTL